MNALVGQGAGRCAGGPSVIHTLAPCCPATASSCAMRRRSRLSSLAHAQRPSEGGTLDFDAGELPWCMCCRPSRRSTLSRCALVCAHARVLPSALRSGARRCVEISRRSLPNEAQRRLAAPLAFVHLASAAHAAARHALRGCGTARGADTAASTPAACERALNRPRNCGERRSEQGLGLHVSSVKRFPHFEFYTLPARPHMGAAADDSDNENLVYFPSRAERAAASAAAAM